MPNCVFCTGRVPTCLGRCLIGLLAAAAGLTSLGNPPPAFGFQRLGPSGPLPPLPDTPQTPPHPWIATAPPAIKRLIDRGSVQLVVDDERLREAGKKGLTRFQLRYEYRYRYELQGIQGVSNDPSHLRGNVVAKIRLLRCETEHSVVVGSSLQPDKPWDHPLVQHEFDHVSISTDPRFLKMAKEVLELPIPCTLTWQRDQGLEQDQVEVAVKEELSARITELERIVQANYDALDRESRDGQANLGERFRFFQELYGLPWLRKCEFQYLDSVRVAAQDRANKEVLEHYLFVD